MTSAMGAARAAPQQIALTAAGQFGRSVTYFLPVAVRHDALGHAAALARVPNGSGDFLALAGTDGFVELPPRSEPFPEGFIASLYRW
jgi:molybdopterin molybdotransferase